jgi:hypothetical protein
VSGVVTISAVERNEGSDIGAAAALGNATAVAWQCGLFYVADSIYHYLLSVQLQSLTGPQSSHSGRLQKP